MTLVSWMDLKFYPKHNRNWDDALFREHILKVIAPEHCMLDVGAGAGIIQAMNFKGHVAKMCGIDLDPRVVDNPMLDEGLVCDAVRIPYPDATFDVVFADNVLEHLDQPEQVFREVARVLKPGGRFLSKTPNKWHYVATIARMTPHKAHELANRWRGRGAVDVFPTLYRANTRRDVTRLAASSGLDVERIERIEARPEYLRFSAPTYVAGMMYERLVNSAAMFEPLRVILINQLRKPLQ